MDTVVSDNTQQVSDSVDTDKPETVSRMAYDKILAEAKKERMEKRALEERLKLEEDKKLTEQSQFKELAEKYKQELDSERVRLQKIAKAAAKRNLAQLLSRRLLSWVQIPQSWMIFLKSVTGKRSRFKRTSRMMISAFL